MADCLFCKIAAGEIPSTKVYEDEVIPKKHIGSADEIDSSNRIEVARVFEAIAKIAKQENLENGYRVVNNCGEDGGQTVHHMHFHLLARRNLAWPPG